MGSEVGTGRLQDHAEGRKGIRVLCVDDDPSMNELHGIVVGRQSDMECVGTLSTTHHLEEEIARTDANVLLLDVCMPESDPLESIREVRARFPKLVILVTSGLDDPAVVEGARARGADGYIPKSTDLQEMVDAIRAAFAGGKPGEVVPAAARFAGRPRPS